jgi:GNAT superfamily N-acetyltransferase
LVRLEQLNPCLQWVLAHYSIDRASWIVNRLTSHVQQGGASGIFVAATSIADSADQGNYPAAIDPDKLCGVAIAIRQPGNSATLLAFQVVGDASSGEVLAPLIERLSQTGVTFIQSGCDDDGQANVLAAGGFEPLANLVMMSLEADQFAAASESAGGKEPRRDATAAVTWVDLDQLGEDWRVHLSSVAGRTFIDTQDCPRLSDFRAADEIVQGYVDATHFDRRLASLMRVDGDWAGCLILTSHSAPEASVSPSDDAPTPPSESGAIELTYMGLVPEYRGKGLAGQLLAKTICSATANGASRVVLAVDRDNRPAAAIYQRLGWREVIGETVWGRKI